jgi:hypothetical protein
MTNPIDDIDKWLWNFILEVGAEYANGKPRHASRYDELKATVKNLLLEARNNALLDLEQWIKLHDLGQDMILDGIEHMVKSNLQVPDQPRLNHADRIAELQKELGNER